jgi:hypothetical protein
MDRQLVSHFVNTQLVSRTKIQRLILRASKEKTGVVRQMLDSGSVSEEGLASALAGFYETERFDLKGYAVDTTALQLISGDMAARQGVLPYAVNAEGDLVSVAIYDPEAASEVLDLLETATGQPPRVLVAARGWLEKAIRHFYFGEAWPERDSIATPSAEEMKAVGDRGAGAQLFERRSKSVSGERSKSLSGELIQQALDDFDAILEGDDSFLSNIDAGVSGVEILEDDDNSVELWDEGVLPASDGNSSGWGVTDQGGSDGFGWDTGIEEGGFDLFEAPPQEDSRSLRELVDRHEQRVLALEKQLKRQRLVMQSLIDLLSEDRILNKKKLRHRISRSSDD